MTTITNLLTRIMGIQTLSIPQAKGNKSSTASLKGFAAAVSMVMDRIAGLCMVSIMGLVVVNVLMRTLLNRPILGTYEYVGFLTAIMIGLSLAYCAFQKGHIAVGFFMNLLSIRIQHLLEVLINVTAGCFWVLAAWYMGRYAYSLSLNNVVSSTTQTPFYHVIYVVGFGLLVLGLVLIVEAIETMKRAVVSE
ncbi:TRAP transporter small permease [Desulfitibacter alkalitolerans]|uniref:TRAP transporter small permease n=1 Tax=Desulfitibacter alkalitolerans TaxID=264641 RepID=UPI00068654C3|nr:TRAP transporter small permease [Desulfitibacter alkalitolerans]